MREREGIEESGRERKREAQFMGIVVKVVLHFLLLFLIILIVNKKRRYLHKLKGLFNPF
jgi:hypothetical protein